MSRNIRIIILLVITSCTFLSCNKAGSSDSVKFQQYYAQGENLFIANCSNCHQRSGEGLGLVYPPVNKSDYIDKKFPEVICLIRNGKRGAIMVNGQEYNQPMYGMSNVTDLEMAELATYIYNTWDHNRGIVEVNEIQKALESCR